MNIVVIASGSKGNVSYITSSCAKILVDVGINITSIDQNLEELGVNPKELKGILITHTHSDHIKGLEKFVKKYHTKVYLSEKMLNDLPFDLLNYEIIGDEFEIEDIHIKSFKLSHDTDDSNGYLLESEGDSLVYITDTGYINNRYFEILKDKKTYVIESNHDVKMLMNSNRPYYLKQRILGDRGHLSNDKCAEYLKKLIGKNTKNIVLIHLSEDNNTPELAYETTSKVVNKDIMITVSSQRERTVKI